MEKPLAGEPGTLGPITAAHVRASSLVATALAAFGLANKVPAESREKA